MGVADPYVQPLTPHVRAYVQPDGGWCLNNAGFVSDGGMTLLVDTAATQRRAGMLRDALDASGVPQPSILVNTHHHGDHTYGNSVFVPRAVVVAHDTCRREQLAAGHALHRGWPDTDFGDIRISAATVTYHDRMTMYVGGVEVRIIHAGVAHTAGDSIVHLPHQGVVFTGDLVLNGGTPFMPNGSLRGTLRALDLLRSLEADVVVPGHGPVTDPSAYDRTEDYLRFVQALAHDAHTRGLTPLQAAREADLGPFAALRESERLVANLHRAYAELNGQPEGSPLDAPAIIQQMTQMNGGLPIACHA